MPKPAFKVGGVPEHFNLPWHLAIEHDLFHEAGLQVDFAEYGGGTGQLTAALDDGELDVAVLLFEGAVRKILNGGQYRIVKLFTDTPLIWGIHVAATSPIKTLDDIEGKRFAISRFGSGSHLIAIVDVSERGWAIDDIQFVKVGNLAGARESLAADESDVFLWEKFMTAPLVENGEFRHIGDRIVPWPAFVIAVRNDVLDESSDEVRTLMDVISQSCRALKADPGAASLIANRYDLNPEDARSWLDRTDWNYDLTYPDQSLKEVTDYLRLLNLLDDPSVDYRMAWFDLNSKVASDSADPDSVD